MLNSRRNNIPCLRTDNISVNNDFSKITELGTSTRHAMYFHLFPLRCLSHPYPVKGRLSILINRDKTLLIRFHAKSSRGVREDSLFRVESRAYYSERLHRNRLVDEI